MKLCAVPERGVGHAAHIFERVQAEANRLVQRAERFGRGIAARPQLVPRPERGCAAAMADEDRSLGVELGHA